MRLSPCCAASPGAGVSAEVSQCCRGAWIKSSAVGLCLDYTQTAKATTDTVVGDAIPPFLAVRLSRLRHPSLGREVTQFSGSPGLGMHSLSAKS